MKKRTVLFPGKGRKPEDIMSYIGRLKQNDARWDTGKMFGFVYYPESPAAEVLKAVSQLYFFENALNPNLFSSIVHLENQTVSMVADLLHGNEDVAGNITLGGTESIFLALKAARDRNRRLHTEITVPEVILPVSVHPAFHKAAHCLGFKTVVLPLSADFKADVSQLSGLLTKNTILIVGSAPSYAHGMIDPIEEMGQFAYQNKLLFHVDACLGGFMLPFAEELGYPIPPFDFRVQGVTSISADFHKFGYGAKGSSVVLYRNRELRKDQLFAFSRWPGGIFGSPTLMGTRSGGPVAAAWTILHLLGRQGYLEMTRKTLEGTDRLKNGIHTIPGLNLVGNPLTSIFSFTSTLNDIFMISEEMESKGWVFDRIAQPEAIHLIVTMLNLAHIDEFLSDLQTATATAGKKKLKKTTSLLSRKVVNKMMDLFPGKAQSLIGTMAADAFKKSGTGNEKGSATFYGIAASRDNKSDIDAMILDILDKTYS